MANAKLIVVEGNPQGMQIPLQGEQFVIGRDPKCNLRPANDLVSKLHCAFLMDAGAVRLRDLGSTNGTFLNGKRIEGSVALADGDLVKVATLVFAVKMETLAPAKSDAIEDDPMNWLLGDSSSPEGNVLEPSAGSTIMDVNAAADLESSQATIEMKNIASDTVTDLPAHNPAKANGGNKDAAADEQAKVQDTREAAQAILNKYMVRRRS